MSRLPMLRALVPWCVLAAASGCGGGGGGGSSGGGGTTPPPPVTYTVGGTVTGLAGTGLVLRNNGGNDLTVTASGSFTFSQAINSGTAYAVTVQTQPGNPEQVCTVASGSGTISANVTNVAVTCATTYQVGGTVSGLVGTGLVLRVNGGGDLTVAANGTFTFATRVAAGGAYAVTVQTQPSNPFQACTVANGSGTMPAANVTNVAVTCVNSYSLGGTVTGLAGTGLVLRNNGGNDLAVTANGAFTFTTRVGVGAAYAVTVAAQPAGPTQNCVVSSGSGTMGTANVTNVAITCTTTPFTVGGTVIGLGGSASGLVLRNNGGNDLTLNANGNFAFSSSVLSGGAYAVTVLTQPNRPARSCTVSNGTGTVGAANVTTVLVLCAGKFAYVTNFLGTDGLSKYQIGSNGALSGIAVNNANAASEPQSVATTPNGDFVYVGNRGSSGPPIVAQEIAIYWNDPNDASEALIPASSEVLPVGAVPSALLMHPNGQFLYVADGGAADVIRVYSVNSTTGDLTPLAQTYAVPTLEAVTLDPSGTFLYAASYDNHTITAFRVNANGTLTVSPNAPRSTGAVASEHAIAVDPTHRFAIATHYREFNILSFTIDQTTGDLSAPVSTISTAQALTNGSTPAVIEPQGRFVYAAIPDGTIQAYSLNQTTGALAALPGSPYTTTATNTTTSPGPIAMTVDPSGQFLYMVNNTTGTIVQMAINRSTGALTEVTPLFNSEPGPSAIYIN